MSKELKRMQKLAGVPVNEKKESINEVYVAGGIVGVGAITQIPPREKSDYEMAFEHFMNEGEEKEVEEGMFDKIKSAVGMETDEEKAYDLLADVYTALYLANWEKVESFLKGEKVTGYPKLGLSDIIDNLKGTEAEKPFDDFIKELNQAYRTKVDEYPQEWDTEKVTNNLSRGTNATLDKKELSTLVSAIKKLGDKLKRNTSIYSENDTMEEAVGIPAEASAIRDAVRKMMKDHSNDADLGAAIRSKFSSK